MNTLLIFAAVLATCSASTMIRALRGEKPGSCPASSGMAGICVFDPNVNCLLDSECPQAKKCCSEGCGKVCKDPISTVHDGSCPAPTDLIGICVLLPNSCGSDGDCAANEKCCHESCNRVCKTAIQHNVVG